jgi:adenylate cyclase
MTTRCGLSTGELVFGAVGAKDWLLFTVHGDEVNVAARLEQLNKTYGTHIMATETTVRRRETPTIVYAIRDVAASGQR